MRNYRVLYTFFIGLLMLPHLKLGASEFEIYFKGKYGQVEVGSKYAGVEFHHSRPLPSRISFYYPVANSLDLSHDYWKRDESMPFSLIITHDNKTDFIGKDAFSYHYTPFSVNFEKKYDDYQLNISYDFCEDMPVVVYRITLQNITDKEQNFQVQTSAVPVLRSCHTYTFFEPTATSYSSNQKDFKAWFNHIDTDSTLFFISNV